MSVGEVASAEILWESFGTSMAPGPCDLISEICCKDGYLIFRTNELYKEGNALIAAKNSVGDILWSWHIWLTDKPQNEIYKNSAGIMLDRNLGATNSMPGSTECLGLLYQW